MHVTFGVAPPSALGVIGQRPGSDSPLIGPPLRLRPDIKDAVVLFSRNSAPLPSPELTDPRGHTFDRDGMREPMRFKAAASVSLPATPGPTISGSPGTTGHRASISVWCRLREPDPNR